MKKAISILLVITMLLSMAVVPVFAEEASNVGGSVENTPLASGASATGNDITPGSLTEQYENEGEWTAVGSWEELVAALSAGAKIYLTADIDAGEAEVDTTNGAKLDGAVIDGNGYTITAKGPLFQHTKNTTFQNLTLNSTLSGIAAGATPLARWENKGYTKVYNVTVNSEVTAGANILGSQSFSGFMIYAQSGSVLENVVVDTTLELTDVGLTKVNSLGVIAARANGATFNNCIARGTVTVGANAFVDSNQVNNGVGGIVGQEMGDCRFIDCTNEADITVTAPITANNSAFGGIIGYSDGATLENCLNKGDITVEYVKSVAGALEDVNENVYVGGAVGFFSAPSSLTKVENQGKVTVSATVMGDVIANLTLNTYVAGVIGYAAATPTLNGVLNVGEISNVGNIDGVEGAAAKVRKAFAAGVLAFANQQASFPATDDMVADYTAKNTGAISSNYYAGGVIGYFSWGAGIVDCVNEGDVTATDVAGGIVAWRAGNNGSDNMNRCTNSGNITLAGVAADKDAGYAGGLIGKGGNRITDSSNSGNVTVNKTVSNHNGIYAAGITGQGADGGSANPSITNCINTGNISNYPDGNCGDRFAAGIIAAVRKATAITGCTNDGTVFSDKLAGGIVCNAYADVTITQTVNNGNVSGKNNTGGMAAVTERAATIDQCTNVGVITDTFRAAGIIGWAKGTTVISGCVNGVKGDSSKGSVTVSSNNDAYSGAGGIVGYMLGGSLVVKGSVNYASVAAAGEGRAAGGIVGKTTIAVTIGGAGADVCATYGAVSATNGAVAGGVIGAHGGVGGLVIVSANANDGTENKAYFATVKGEFALPAADTFRSVGHRFKAWALTADGAAVESETLAITGDTDLYALWEDVVFYTITFDGAGAEGSMENTGVNEGEEYILPNCDFTYAKKHFDGWLVNGEKKAVGDVIAPTEDMTVTAVWVDAIYQVTFDANGGIGDAVVEDLFEGYYKLPLTTDFTAPDGKQFKGWAADKSGKSMVYTYNIESAVTFYAIWEDFNHLGATATGNYIEVGSLTEGYEAEGWTAISSWEEFAQKVEAGGKYYFTNDIVATSMLDVSDKLDGTVIDGNGYTLTATQPLFQHTNNTTFRNMTLFSELGGIAAGATPLAYWENRGYTKVYNVTVKSTVIVGANTFGSQSFSGLMIYAQSGSEFKNVIVDTVLDMTNSGLTQANSIGVIAGRANNAIFENCIARGTVTVGANAYVDSNQTNNGVGGIVGQETGDCRFIDCTNEADITVAARATANNKAVGGIVGYSDGMDLENCVNKGNISVAADHEVGGIMGTVSGILTMYKCINAGDISGGAYAGGIIGYAAKADISGCINSGDISDGAYTGGIVGYAKRADLFNCINAGEISDSENYIAGLVAYAESGRSSIKDSVSLGDVENAPYAAPIANGAKVTECYYIDGGFDGEAADGIAVTREEALVKTMGAYSKAIDALIVFAEKVAEDAEYYVGGNKDDIDLAIEAARNVCDTPIFTMDSDDVVLNLALLIDAEEAYDDLLAEMQKITLSSKAKAELDAAIADAENFIAENTAVYTVDTWNRFTAALSAVRAVRSRENNPGDAVSALNELKTARNELKKGGVILSGADLTMLEGQDGEFYLMKDITVSAPINNFKGTLYGNGYTVTLNGCALFAELDGAKIYDLSIKGNAGGAKSLMGKALGEVLVQGVMADTTKLSDAVFFDSAADEAKITVFGAIIYSDAGIAAVVGDVNCQVAVSTVYVAGNTPAVVGAVKSGSAVEKAYIDGKLFVSDKGGAITDAKVLASGRVAYVMNEAFAKFAEVLGTKVAAFADLYFVQVIGEDAAPAVGKPAADGTNVVVRKGSLSYKNLNEKYTGDGNTDVILPALPDISELGEVIAKADALDETKYTPESFAAFKVLLEAAKVALGASTQLEVDSAKDSLQSAMKTLVEKTVIEEEIKVDYSALDLVLAKAAVLKEADYSKETWASLEAMLLRAKLARESSSQKDVDVATAGLMGAINALKAPVAIIVEESDNDAVKTEPEEKGCGSLIGGAAVAITAIIALAGVSLKKKED